ncbi:MAG: VOC family protein [Planctomycetota bacterium]|nr:VOC family protein [Planctomycetota bacterium]
MNLRFVLCAALIVTPLALSRAEDPAPQKPTPTKVTLAAVEGFAYDGSTINSVGVRDIKVSKAWYQAVLGCKVFYELEAQGWCELTTPCTDAIIGLNEDPDHDPAPVNAMSFGVKDMTAAKAWLEKHEVKLEGDVIEMLSIVKLLYFRDPDGNRLMFYQALSAR